jgi:HD-like signal output (HDOD) protein
MPFDVVVSDMRMPDMDGGELLQTVKAEQPHAVRLILSGHSDPVSVMRAVNRTHQYLAKPCDPEVLKATIDRALRLRELLADPVIHRLAGSVGTLPSVPSVYQELVACLQSPQSSVTEVGRIIGRDVAMTAKVLQLVNSAYFGLPRQVSSAERAAALLGLDTLMALVLGHGLFATTRLPAAATLHVAELWEHSLATAGAARRLAQALGFDTTLREQAFLAGMLHDAGVLLLAAGMPEAYTAAVAGGAGHAEESALERAAFGASHAEVGAYLLGIWGLPDPVVEAVAWHEVPPQLAGPSLPLVVHVADRLVATGYATDAVDPELLASAGLGDRWVELVAAARGSDGAPA